MPSALPASDLPPIGAAHFSFTPVAPARIVAAAEAAGVQVLRVELFWEDAEIVKGQHVMPPQAAATFAALRAAGIRPLVLLDYGNSHYPGSGGWNLPPRDLEACRGYADWAAWVATQVEDAWGFELYNEPNNPTFWAEAPDPQQYAQLLSATLPAIHRARPTARLLTGGVGPCLGPWGDAGSFMAAVLNAADPAALRLLHSIAIHPYDNRGSAAFLPEALDAFRTRSGWSGGVSITEWGVEDDWVGGDQHRRAIFESLMPLYAVVSGVKLLTSYSLIDSGPDRANPQMTFGLFRADLTPKPAVATRRAIMDAMAGCQSFEVSGPNKGMLRLALHKSTGTTLIDWRDDGLRMPTITG